jgi:hypothetical protein
MAIDLGTTPTGTPPNAEQKAQIRKVLETVGAAPITGLTGGGAANLDGVVTVGLASGTLRLVDLSGQLAIYIGRSGSAAEVVPDIIRSNDQPTAYYWQLVGGLSSAATVRGNLVLTSVVAGFSTTIIPGTPTADWQLSPPDCSGQLALTTQMARLVPVSGATITIARKRSQFFKLSPANSLASLAFVFPAAVDCEEGQTVTVRCSHAVLSVSVNPGSDNSMVGSFTSLLAGEVVAFIYDPVDATWTRIA